MGEQLGPDVFRIAEFSFTRRSGSLVSFTRDMGGHRRTLEKFFRKTGRDYQRFNYLGEWHSHPQFPVLPSGSDCAAMQAIVNDRSVGASFAVLLIVRLRPDSRLEIGPYLFVPGERRPYAIACVLVPEDGSPDAGRTEGLTPPASGGGPESEVLNRGLSPEDADGNCGS